jgi:hypothetical protein
MATISYSGSGRSAPKGIFMPLTVPQIESIMQKAVEQILAGRAIMEYSDSGTTVGKQWVMAPDLIMIECRYALQIKDPERYGQMDRVRVGNLLNNFRGL